MRFALVLCLALVACKKEKAPELPPSLSPKELTVEKTYHAVACGPVIALWAGNDDALKDMPAPAPKTFGVESLSFRFADGSTKGFAPRGQVFFNDWRFDIFSPDCSQVALLTDHYGPYEVVKVADLRGYLSGKVKPVEVQALSEKDALVHADLVWVDPTHFEFSASCCGGAQVFKADTKDGSLERLLDAPTAPKGVRKVNGKYEVVP